jgi:hypothetical protein
MARGDRVLKKGTTRVCSVAISAGGHMKLPSGHEGGNTWKIEVKNKGKRGKIETAKAQRIKKTRRKKGREKEKVGGGERINKVTANSAQHHLFVGCNSYALLFLCSLSTSGSFGFGAVNFYPHRF